LAVFAGNLFRIILIAVFLVLAASLVSSVAGAVDILATLHGEAQGDQYGISISDAGDVNGDGYQDLLVGANLSDAGGTLLESVTCTWAVR